MTAGSISPAGAGPTGQDQTPRFSTAWPPERRCGQPQQELLVGREGVEPPANGV